MAAAGVHDMVARMHKVLAIPLSLVVCALVHIVV